MIEKNKSVHILSIDAKDLYLSNHYINPSPVGYSIRNKDGDILTRKFINALDYSLDLIKLREVYEKVYRRHDFGFFVRNDEYTYRVINVTFKYSVKDYNMFGKDLYIKNGYCQYSDIDLQDCIDVRDGEVIAIKLDSHVEKPISNEVLGKYFYYEDGVYKTRGNFKTLINVAQLREMLYEDGFICNGIKFVRFKRSSGSARVGKCLFIDEKLYPKMHKWELCGLKVERGQDIDLAALEAYISLTLSSIIDTIEINPENILVIDDYESVFKDKVIAVRENENNNLVSAPEEVEISNSIWDGQSLLDSSMFGAYSGYGMILLRNSFFKSCCFNCNIQKFFEDNGITEISQLNGQTLAKDIRDVKMITTPSSIKYLKFGSLQQWLERIDPMFGVVKHEKKTHFFDGRLVETHYQLLNTLQMTKSEMKEFLEPAIRYYKYLRDDPAVVRHYIRYPESNKFWLPPTPLLSKNDIVYRFLGLNDKFTETAIYDGFKRDLLTHYRNNLKSGRVLVNGNYETLLGNPMEMLMQSIGEFKGKSQLGEGHVHTKRFGYDVVLLGSRSPHINPGNVWLTRNVEDEDIDKYFNLTEEILCINAINENIQQRLNGCDYDSDSLLVTDNEYLIKAAQKNYDRFYVPTNFVSGVKRKRQYTPAQLADLDIKTSANKIGDIVNLSQELNTLMWHMINNGESWDEAMKVFYDSSQLCIMSGIEIDSAKREFAVSNTKELKKLSNKYRRRDKDDRAIKPNFFGHVSRQKGYYNPQKKNYKHHDTAMDYLQQIVNKECREKRGKGGKKRNFISLVEIADRSKFEYSRIKYDQINQVLDAVRQMRHDINELWAQYNTHTDYTDSRPASIPKDDWYALSSKLNTIRQRCVDYIDKMKISYSTMYWLLKLTDNNAAKDIKRTLFYILFASPNKSFFALIQESATPIPILEEAEDGEINLFGIRYNHKMTHEEEQYWGYDLVEAS